MFYTLHLGLSYRCNMKCKHCFVEKCSDRINPQIAIKLLEKLEKKGLFVVYYTFGEPTLASDWLTVAHAGANLGLAQIIMSNGYLIDKKVAQAIKQVGISRVMISIDHANPSKHDANRGIQGAFQHAINAVRALKAAEVPVGIATTITSDNDDSIYDIYRLAQDLNADSISFLRERKNGMLIDADLTEYDRFFSEYITTTSHTVPVHFHDPLLINYVNAAYEKGLLSLDSYTKWTEMNSCHYDSTLSIAPNGDVMHCNLSEHIIGNIFDDEIENILKKESDCYAHPVCCPFFSWPSI